jgi:sortase A
MRAVARGAGELLITLGVVVLLFTGYELFGTGIGEARAQHQLLDQLHDQWQHGGTSAVPQPTASGKKGTPKATTLTGPSLGSGLAILRIPRFGADWTPRVVVQGVSLADLRRGPGHYPTSALPGQLGNFAVAGHRATHGNGFFKMNELRPGDPVVVETRDTWFTYRVTGSTRVLPTDVGVVLPVPGHPGAKPTQRLLTLTTCDPWWSSAHRLIVSGVLQSSLPKSKGLPPALQAKG